MGQSLSAACVLGGRVSRILSDSPFPLMATAPPSRSTSSMSRETTSARPPGPRIHLLLRNAEARSSPSPGATASNAPSYYHSRGKPACTNAVQLRQEIVNPAIIEAISAPLSPEIIEASIQRAIEKIRDSQSGRDGDARALEKRIAESEARERISSKP